MSPISVMKAGYNKPVGTHQEVCVDLALITSLAVLLGLAGVAIKRQKELKERQEKSKVRVRK